MTEEESDKLVLDTMSRYAGGGAGRPEARFVEDLRLSDMARQGIFAHLAESFSARGVSLPSRGFYLKDFLACTSPGDVQSTIRSRVFKRPAAAHAEKAAAEKAAAKAPEEKQAPEMKAPAVQAPEARPPEEKPPAAPAAERLPERPAAEPPP